ncbi:MAG: hypothetical protein IBJ17_18125, partial [Reyranella sp.]|nr:hypothetical protein [Reyranella sp.]
MGVQRIGAGSFSTTIPDGAAEPQLFNGADATPRVSGDAAHAPVPTNDWCASLGFNDFGSPAPCPPHADPIQPRAAASGRQYGYPSATPPSRRPAAAA